MAVTQLYVSDKMLRFYSVHFDWLFLRPRSAHVTNHSSISFLYSSMTNSSRPLCRHNRNHSWYSKYHNISALKTTRRKIDMVLSDFGTTTTTILIYTRILLRGPWFECAPIWKKKRGVASCESEAWISCREKPRRSGILLFSWLFPDHLIYDRCPRWSGNWLQGVTVLNGQPPLMAGWSYAC
jgi:hypothetical protein